MCNHPTLIALTCSFGLVFSPVAKPSPLLDQVHKLKCADNQSSAETELKIIQALSTRSIGLPTEDLASDESEAHIAAGSLDITLDTLVNTAQKYPALRDLVERTLLQWNYCRVFENNQFYDLYEDQARRLALYKPPLAWSGFQRLGFLNPPATFIPLILSQPILGERAFEAFFHRIYRQQCFPHPTTGQLFHHQYQVHNQRLFVDQTDNSNIYPYYWKPDCKIEKIVSKVTPPPVAPPPVETIQAAEPPEQEIIVISPPEPPMPEPEAPPPPEPVAPAPAELPIVQAEPVIEEKPDQDEIIYVEPAPEKPKVETKPVIEKPKTVNLTVPEKEHEPIIVVAVPPSSASNAQVSAVISEHPEETLGFTGNLYSKRALAKKGHVFGVAASWKPIRKSFWFVRTNIAFEDKADSPITYSWGLGYDDWHQGTWSIQINNWGPIKPGEGLAFDKATANIGYKIKSDALSKFKLSTNTSLDIPIDGDLAANFGAQWSPKENWYFRANIHQPIDNSDVIWSYGFGYSNWRTNKVNVEYANFGANELFDTNFRKDGTVTVSYNWEF